MRHMIEPSAAKAAFAPAWPYVYKVPGRWQIFPPFGRVSVFNRDLTIEELKPLTEGFPVPGRILRLIGLYSFVVSGFLQAVLWLGTILIAFLFAGIEFSEADEQAITAFVKSTFSAAASLHGWAILAAILVGGAGIVVDFVAWKKWTAALTTAWERCEGRIVRTKALPGKRRQQVNSLGGDLDSALEQLDANDPGARLLMSNARDAIGRYIDLPVISKDSRRVARSAVNDGWVQKIRDAFEAAEAAETAALQEAEDAVLAVKGYVGEVKAAAAEREIIELAKTIAAGAGS